MRECFWSLLLFKNDPALVEGRIFFYQDLVATTGVTDLPFEGGSHRPKNLKNPKKEEEEEENNIKHSHSHSHTHIYSYTP